MDRFLLIIIWLNACSQHGDQTTLDPSSRNTIAESNACYRENEAGFTVAFKYLKKDIQPSPFLSLSAFYWNHSQEVVRNYNLLYVPGKCDNSIPIKYGSPHTHPITIDFYLRVYPHGLVFASFNVYFDADNHDQMLYLDDEHGVLGMYAFLTKHGSDVLPQESTNQFHLPQSISAAGHDCAVIFNFFFAGILKYQIDQETQSLRAPLIHIMFERSVRDVGNDNSENMIISNWTGWTFKCPESAQTPSSNQKTNIIYDDTLTRLLTVRFTLIDLFRGYRSAMAFDLGKDMVTRRWVSTDILFTNLEIVRYSQIQGQLADPARNMPMLIDRSVTKKCSFGNYDGQFTDYYYHNIHIGMTSSIQEMRKPSVGVSIRRRLGPSTDEKCKRVAVTVSKPSSPTQYSPKSNSLKFNN